MPAPTSRLQIDIALIRTLIDELERTADTRVAAQLVEEIARLAQEMSVEVPPSTPRLRATG